MRINENGVGIRGLILSIICILALIMVSVAFPGNVGAGAEKVENFEVSGDIVDLGADPGMAKITGHVVMKYKGYTLNGDSAEFFEATMRAVVRGGVSLRSDEMTITCAELEVFLQEEKMVARGKVSGVYERAAAQQAGSGEGSSGVSGGQIVPAERIVMSSDVLEFANKERLATLSGNARVETRGRVFTGEKILVYLKENRIVGKGNARLMVTID